MARMGSPAMTDQCQAAKIIELERAVLCALCCELIATGDGNTAEMQNRGGEALRDAVRDLASYPWRGTEHAVVYTAIVKLQPAGDATVAEQLPAQVTRTGFPDVDWKLYLRPNDGRPVELAELILKLKAAATNNSLTPE